jgi:hypothetical protein
MPLHSCPPSSSKCWTHISRSLPACSK